MERSSFSRQNLLQERVSLRGNMSSCLSLQYRPASVVFAEFTHQATRQRVFCVLINHTEVLIINNIMDLFPKPFAVSDNNAQGNEVTISRNDGKYCTMLFETSQSFSVWQNLLSEALAEAICCDAMKTLKSGRLSAVRMNRCLNVCKLLTKDAQLLTQIKRLRSIRFQINSTMQELRRKECKLSSPDVRKVKVSCNFLRFVYPTVRCDPDLTFLTEQLSGGKCSAADLEQICQLLLNVEQEDRREFLRMVKLSAGYGDSNGSIDINNSTGTAVLTSLVSPSQKEATASSAAVHRTPLKVKRVSWDKTVMSNEKTRAGSRSRKASGRRSPCKLRANSLDSVLRMQSTDIPTNTAQAPELTAPPRQSQAESEISLSRFGDAQIPAVVLPAPQPAPTLSLVPPETTLVLPAPGGASPLIEAAPVPTTKSSLYLMELWCKDSASPIRSPQPSPLPSSAAPVQPIQVHVPPATVMCAAVSGSPRSPTRNRCSPVLLTPPSTPITTTTSSDGYALVTNATPVLTVNGKAVQGKGGGSGKRTASTPAKDDSVAALHALHPLRVTWLAMMCSVLLIVLSACLYTACFGAPLILSYSSHTYGSNGYSTVTFSLSSSNAAVSAVRDDPADAPMFDVSSSSMPPAMHVPLPPPLPAIDKALPAVAATRKSRAHNTKDYSNKAQTGAPGSLLQTHKHKQGSSTHTKNAFSALSKVVFSPFRMLRNMIAGIGRTIGRFLFRTARV